MKCNNYTIFSLIVINIKLISSPLTKIAGLYKWLELNIFTLIVFFKLLFKEGLKKPNLKKKKLPD